MYEEDITTELDHSDAYSELPYVPSTRILKPPGGDTHDIFGMEKRRNVLSELRVSSNPHSPQGSRPVKSEQMEYLKVGENADAIWKVFEESRLIEQPAYTRKVSPDWKLTKKRTLIAPGERTHDIFGMEKRPRLAQASPGYNEMNEQSEPAAAITTVTRPRLADLVENTANNRDYSRQSMSVVSPPTSEKRREWKMPECYSFAKENPSTVPISNAISPEPAAFQGASRVYSDESLFNLQDLHGRTRSDSANDYPGPQRPVRLKQCSLPLSDVPSRIFVRNPITGSLRELRAGCKIAGMKVVTIPEDSLPRSYLKSNRSEIPFSLSWDYESKLRMVGTAERVAGVRAGLETACVS